MCSTLVGTLEYQRLLATPLSALPGWGVVARCADPCCPPNRVIDLADILDVRGDMPAAALVRHLRCSACGGPAAGARLQRHHGEVLVVHRPDR
jgi:hypothetical protein